MRPRNVFSKSQLQTYTKYCKKKNKWLKNIFNLAIYKSFDLLCLTSVKIFCKLFCAFYSY